MKSVSLGLFFFYVYLWLTLASICTKKWGTISPFPFLFLPFLPPSTPFTSPFRLLSLSFPFPSNKIQLRVWERCNRTVTTGRRRTFQHGIV